ncbi:MAG: hypothetical protein HYZ49_03855 [Chloroflexi bacterium]|nr:hypothetical protein [Chloroflexota bacterium]
MNEQPSVEDYDSIIGLFLADHPEMCTFERQQLGRAVVYVISIEDHEAGRITVEPPTKRMPGISIGHNMTAKMRGVYRELAKHGIAARVPEPEAELNRRFLNICGRIQSEIDYKLRKATRQSAENNSAKGEQGNTLDPFAETEIEHRRGIVAKALQKKKADPRLTWKQISQDSEIDTPVRTLTGWRKDPRYKP